MGFGFVLGLLIAGVACVNATQIKPTPGANIALILINATQLPTSPTTITTTEATETIIIHEIIIASDHTTLMPPTGTITNEPISNEEDDTKDKQESDEAAGRGMPSTQKVFIEKAKFQHARAPPGKVHAAQIGKTENVKKHENASAALLVKKQQQKGVNGTSQNITATTITPKKEIEKKKPATVIALNTITTTAAEATTTLATTIAPVVAAVNVTETSTIIKVEEVVQIEGRNRRQIMTGGFSGQQVSTMGDSFGSGGGFGTALGGGLGGFGGGGFGGGGLGGFGGGLGGGLGGFGGGMGGGLNGFGGGGPVVVDTVTVQDTIVPDAVLG